MQQFFFFLEDLLSFRTSINAPHHLINLSEQLIYFPFLQAHGLMLGHCHQLLQVMIVLKQTPTNVFAIIAYQQLFFVFG